MAINEIKPADIVNKGVIGLADVPGLTTAEMQKRMDELATDVIIPKVNELVKGANATNESLGAKVSTRFIKGMSILDTSLEDGQYTFNDAIDAPFGSSGYLKVQTHNNAPDLYRKVTWKLMGNELEYYNTMVNGVWQGWKVNTTIGLKIAYGQWNPAFTTTGEKETDIDIGVHGFTQTPTVICSVVGKGYTQLHSAQVNGAYTTATNIKLSAYNGETVNFADIRVNWVAIGV